MGWGEEAMSGVSSCHLLNGFFFYVRGIRARSVAPFPFIVRSYVPSGNIRKKKTTAATSNVDQRQTIAVSVRAGIVL